MESLAAVCLSGLVLFAASGLGRMARTRRLEREESLDERFLYDTVVGMGILSLLMFVLAALHLLHCRWIPAAVCGLGLLGVGIWLPEIVNGVARFFRRERSKSHVLCGLLLLALFVSAFVPAVAPPAMSDWDSLAYHMAVVKLWVKRGGFYYIDFVSHSNFPFLLEMLYVPGIMIDQPGAAKLVHYWVGVLLVTAVVVLARRHISRGSAWPSALALAGMPIVLWEATTAYIDLATALYTVVSVCLLLNYFDTSDRHYLTASAVCTGFAASTKMTGLLLIPLLFLWLVIDRRFLERQFILKDAARFAVLAIAVCSPWYVKTLVYTGNPVYPFFYRLFDGRDWSLELARNYSMLQREFGLGRSVHAFLTLPYDLTFRSDAFYDTPGLYVGPLFLAAVPVLIVARCGSKKLAGLLCLFAAQLVVWFAMTQQSRYLIPALALLAPLASGLLWRDMRLQKARSAWWTMVIATALFGLVTLVPGLSQSLPYMLGVQDRDEYLTKALDIYPAVKFANENLPANSKLALFGDTRGFYLDCDYVWADYGHNLRFSEHCASLEEFLHLLKSNNVTHVLVNFRFFPREQDAVGNAKLVYQAIRTGRFEPIYPRSYDGGSAAIFRIR